MEKIYLSRLIEKTIKNAMLTTGCVVIEGAKWCGKSTTAERFSKSVVKLQKPATYKQYKILADIGDEKLLEGEKPLLFDEWQKIPELWDYIRNEIDETNGKGLFLLTGSTKPIEDKERHSGIGRIEKIIMRTMSLWESQESTGEVSLGYLFAGADKISGKNPYQLKDIAYILCRGGFPSSVTEKNKSISSRHANNYVNTLLKTDIVDVDGVKRDPKKARAILRAYARNISTRTPATTILKDIEANFEVEDIKTLYSYINAFEQLFVIEETESWTPKLRSKTAIRTTHTRHMVDPSIATSVLYAKEEDLMNDLKTFGLLFENLVIRDLKVYAQHLDGGVYSYRDKDNLEIDAVIHLNNGKWGLIEIKIGGEKLINEAAENLKALSNKIDQEKMNEPSFLAVVTAATEFAYKRKDGVFVIPIACLKP